MINPEYISSSHLESDSDLTIIDTRLGDDYDSGHLPGAVSNCVFEMAFIDRISEQAPDKTTMIVLYGSEDRSYEAPVAYEKLKRAGYENVKVLAGGFQDWMAAGLPVERESSENTSSSEVEDGQFPIDLDESRIEWTGRNLLKRHWGTLKLTSGNITVAGGKPVSGEFIIDMNSIQCLDLEGNDSHDVLIQHLKSDDFFDVGSYPECRVSIISSELIQNASQGSPNLNLDLNIRLKDVRSMISVKSTAGITPEGKLAAQASFSFDRTMWEVIYGSGRFFSNLGMHLVNDLIDIDLKIVTK